MSEPQQSRKYEDNYSVLERITESLNKDEVGIDDLVEKTREALDAARICMEILNRQRGEFKKLESEFSQLLQNSADQSPAGPAPRSSDEPPPGQLDGPPLSEYDAPPLSDEEDQLIGEDDPF